MAEGLTPSRFLNPLTRHSETRLKGASPECVAPERRWKNNVVLAAGLPAAVTCNEGARCRIVGAIALAGR